VLSSGSGALRLDKSRLLRTGDPKFEYFLDPTQNPVADFFGFLNPNNTFIGSVSGPNVITYAPCFVGVAPTGVSLSAAVLNVIPALLAVTPTGAHRPSSLGRARGCGHCGP
jgi:hypothetical protein